MYDKKQKHHRPYFLLELLRLLGIQKSVGSPSEGRQVPHTACQIDGAVFHATVLHSCVISKPPRRALVARYTARLIARNWIGRLCALAAELSAPEARVELGEDGLDLPSGGGGVEVRGLEDVDALDGGLGTEVSGPSEGNGVTGDGVDVEDGEANGRLSPLTGDECLLGGECGRAEWNAGQEVDRVRGVSEVGSQQGVGDVDVEGGQERGEAADQVAGRGAGQAGDWCAWSTRWCCGGGGPCRSTCSASLGNGGRKAGQGRDNDGAGGELHFGCLKGLGY